MNFTEINFGETVYAIRCITERNREITVKKIRQVHGIKASNRSKINFIWRALKNLVTQNFLRHIVHNVNGPKIYKLTSSGKEFITNFKLKRNLKSF